jgi:ssDNA-binding Zn-finger/Zn-ribbon topoisomerase 1
MTTTPLDPSEFPGYVADLACPDCGGILSLKRSKFGIFYGCSAFLSTGCRGAHSANGDGSPVGIPAEKITRRLRAELVQVVKRAISQGSFVSPTLSIGTMNADECRELAFSLRMELGELTRHERISLEL